MFEKIARNKEYRLAYWATIENYRWWLANDQIYLQLIAERGKFSANIVRTIAKAYGVNRGIPSSEDKKADETAAKIADVLNNFDVAAFGRLGLSDKVKLFRETIEAMPMNQDGKARKNTTFVSGTSKLIWFLAPDGWTMFDRLAADGIGIAKSGSSMARAEKYYAVLADRGFEEKTRRIRETLDQSDFRDLHPERLIDKFLWLAGCEEEMRDNSILTLGFYRNGLFPEVGRKLDNLATKIADTLQSDLAKLIPGTDTTSKKKK